MKYRVNPKNGESLSQLGLGCMRFPRKSRQIDQEKTTEMINHAIELGINYFDTAYIYSGSEEALGRALQALNKRDAVRIATKLPPYMCNSRQDFDKIFNKQLERLRTDRVDYYLIHMLADAAALERLRSLGLDNWAAEKKRSGAIINLGFSFHGGREEFKRLVDAYDWDFCMVQYNYFDENNQAGKEGVRYASEKGLPVFIMEPLRGGMLVNLPDHAGEIFTKPVESAFSWLYDQPEPTVVLSGMSDIRQLDENTALASMLEPGHLTEHDRDKYKQVVEILNSSVKVACTGCNYCMPCPQGVDIPTCFSAYNETYTRSFFIGMKRYFMTTGALSAKQHNASRCKKCGKCERHCPQSIQIGDRLDDVTRRMEGFWFRPLSALARKILLRTRKS